MATRGQRHKTERATLGAYAALASHYDRFFAGQRAVWRRARKRLLSGVVLRPRAVCDLCCGTGNTALEFARRGALVFAVDRSPAMCRSVRRKARKHRLSIRVLCANMQSLRLPEAVDLVICEFHSLNHLLREKDLRRALRRVRAALRPGGLFFFDCAHQAMYESASAEGRCNESRDFFLLRSYEFDRVSGRACFTATWFVRRGADWRRFDERIRQVPWSKAQTRRALRREGFEILTACDGARFLPQPDARRSRGFVTFFLARKV